MSYLDKNGLIRYHNGINEKFDEVNDALTDLEQDYNNIPSNKMSVHLSGKRTHEGVVVTTDIGNIKNTFMVLPIQYDVFDLDNGVNKLRLFVLFNIPEEYLGRCLGAFYQKKYTSEPSEMLTNTTDGIQRGGSANVITNTVTGCLAVNISFTDDDWSGGLIYRSLRLGIEIYTDNTRSTLERVIYSEQFTYRTNSMNPFSAELTNVSSSDITDEGAIWGGYLAIPKNKYNNMFGISDFEYLSQIADSKTQAGSNPGVVTALVPYEENKSVVSILRYGGIYSVSNAISIEPPSNTMTKSVSSGDTFMLDDLWYTATTDLAVGDMLVVGTNCLAIDEPIIPIAELNNKADIDGTYEELTAGYANNLKFTGYREDNTPYILRQSGGDVDPGYKSEKTIVGASIVRNQQKKNGNFESTTYYAARGGTLTVADNIGTLACNGNMTGTLQYGLSLYTIDELVIGHKYFATINAKSGKADRFRIRFSSGTAYTPEISANTWCEVPIVTTAVDGDGTFTIYAEQTAQYIAEDILQFKNCMLFDLTSMFGTNIADYVYSLEQSTTGAGIIWLKEHFPKQFNSGYQTYNAGEIKSISGLSAYKSVGFNQWDEEWEVGLISGTTGQNVSGSGIRSKNMNRCIPNTSYYYKVPGNAKYVMWYDADENFISPGYRESDGVLTSPSNAAYFRLRVDGITTYSNDICINISKTTGTPKNGDYAPYDAHSYALDDSLILRGIYKLDANNKLYADGDVYKADGTVGRKYGSVILNGTQSMISNFTSGGYVQYDTRNFDDGEAKEYGNGINTYYRWVTNGTSTGTFMVLYKEAGYTRFLIRDERFGDTITSATQWNSWLASNPLTVVYELATPTTETAEPFSSSQRVNPDGTEEFIFDSTTEVKLPVGHVTKYMDQAALLDEIITLPDKAGTYALRKTVSDGVTTYTWEDDVIPSISVSKADGVSTITVTDETGTNSVEIADGETPHLVLLSYGTSTWTDFIDAYTTNSIVYCRASSNSNPASGSKTRLAFMAYVNNETNPTNVEFQYYRSVNQHSATQQGDQVYVYKLDKTAGWTVTVRESYTRVVAGTKMSSTWSNGILTMNFDGHDLPSGGTTGQVLKKTSGTDYDASWGDIPSEYVTNTDYADSSTGGVVKVDDGTMGVKLSNDNVLQTNGANSQIIKVGENTYRPICPNYQHESVFYGLAKAAGDGTQKNSNNSVGTYTDNAKRAIRNMMGVPHYAYDLELGQSVGEYDNLNSFYLGVYSCDATTAATVSNTPITNAAYKLICEATSNNTVRQTVITTTGQIYIRTGDNSTSSWVWSNWAVQSNSGGSGSSNNTNILNGSATGSLRSVNSEQEGSNYTIGLNAAAFCYNSVALGTGSFAENSGCAEGDYSHAEGTGFADGNYSHAEGNGYAEGDYSHAEGYYTHAYENYQHVFGTYNKYYRYVDPINLQNSEAIEIVGNGTSNNPSNARTLDFLGNERLAGSITLGADTNDEVTLTATELATLKTLAGIESEVF